MTSTSFRPRRRAIVAAAAALPLVGLAACGSDTGDGPDLGGAAEGDEEGSPLADVIASGPVAEDDAISASAWAAAN